MNARIKIAKGRPCFLDEKSDVFTPWGVNYIQPGTGWAPKFWKSLDFEKAERDFELLAELGTNVVRVFLTRASFMNKKGGLAREGLDKLLRLGELAWSKGIRLYPTGPDHWEGPAPGHKWVNHFDIRYFASLLDWWNQIAKATKETPWLFAWDLLNEAFVPWSPDGGNWCGWLEKRYGSMEKAAEVLSSTTDELEKLTDEKKNGRSVSKKVLKECAEWRESFVKGWVRAQAATVRRADIHALVTASLIQWNFPVRLFHPVDYTAFRPHLFFDDLDFIDLHFYPIEKDVYLYESEEAEDRNLNYFEMIARLATFKNMPMMVGEYGWYGGGGFPREDGVSPYASEEQQRDWCEKLVRHSAKWACGWLNWTLYDYEQAKDVTKHTGLLNFDGKPKAWAEGFEKLGKEMKGKVPENRPEQIEDFQWDDFAVDTELADLFRENFRKSRKTT